VKGLRLRLSTLLWLVALAAAFLGGIRYAEYREASREMEPATVVPITAKPGTPASAAKLIRVSGEKDIGGADTPTAEPGDE
jgi:hypothetical protein